MLTLGTDAYEPDEGGIFTTCERGISLASRRVMSARGVQVASSTEEVAT